MLTNKTVEAPPRLEHNFHPRYRPDIDGLRAVAIISVVLFHAFPSLVQGGFVGVDVFFVISGFLISGIIFRSLQEEDFFFTEFYSHRIKRIFPALITVLVASYVFGWFSLLPDEFKQLGKHMAAGAGFVQNFVLWKEAGYFDTASELKPLMHLWSLAIEEQFYLIYPVLIWASYRFRLNALAVVVIIGISSLLSNINTVNSDPVKAFFIPKTRIWELLSGATLAYFHFFKPKAAFFLKNRTANLELFINLCTKAAYNKKNLELISSFGLMLVILAITIINKENPFPGWRAILPVTGAILIIYSGPSTWTNKNLLGNRFMVFIGKISYPLYLWHWPILSYAQIVRSENPAFEIRVAAVTASFVLAWLTYFFIERPIRFGNKTWVTTAFLSFFLAIIGFIGFNTYIRNGLELREPIKKYSPFIQDFSWNINNLGYEKCNNSTNSNPTLGFCAYSKEIKPKFAIFGDSHAEHLFYGLANKDPSPWLLIGNSSCAPVSGGVRIVGSEKNCDALVEKALNVLTESQSIRYVVISFFGNYANETSYAADHLQKNIGPSNIKITGPQGAGKDRWEIFFYGLNSVISTLENAGKKVIITIDLPELPFFPRSCLGRPFLKANTDCSVPVEEVMRRQTKMRELIKKINIAHPDILIFDPQSLICDTMKCSPFRSGVYIYRDSHHLSLRGSDLYANKFIDWLKTEKIE